MLLDRKRAVRDQLQKSMPLYEEKIRDQNTDYEMKKEMYDKNLISKSEVDKSEQALTRARLETERTRKWIAEDDRALALAEQTAADELKGAPRRAPNDYPSTAALIRYDGMASWSVATGFDKIDNFYHERFGRPLPISAEGRDLIAYLREAGIPFIAFGGKIFSMSTGAHIHIGRPSPRLAEVKQRMKRAAARNDDAERG